MSLVGRYYFMARRTHAALLQNAFEPRKSYPSWLTGTIMLLVGGNGAACNVDAARYDVCIYVCLFSAQGDPDRKSPTGGHNALIGNHIE